MCVVGWVGFRMGRGGQLLEVPAGGVWEEGSTEEEVAVGGIVAQGAPKGVLYAGPTARHVRVDGVLYDAAGMAKEHPGGELFVRAFAGRDASEAFLSYHRKAFPHARHAHLRAKGDGVAEGNAEVVPGEATRDEEYLALVKEVEAVLPRGRWFATPAYFVKAVCLLAGTVALEGWIHATGAYHWRAMAPLGFLFALIGLNVQHDANHGALSRQWRVNRYFGLAQNYIGGSMMSWVHQHVVQHHVHTNDVSRDPDCQGAPIIRMNPTHEPLPFMAAQHVFVFLALPLLGLKKPPDDMLVNAGLSQIHTPYGNLVGGYRAVDFAWGLFFFARFLGAPLALGWARTSPAEAVVGFAAMAAVGGLYLALFFIISHNFEGVHFFDGEEAQGSEYLAHGHAKAGDTYAPAGPRSFVYRQVASSSNVGGAWLGFLNGGLNYQIEHHLFPRMSHVHYPKVAPVVAAFCKARDIPYVHFPHVAANWASTLRHLAAMGSKRPHEVYRPTRRDAREKKAT